MVGLRRGGKRITAVYPERGDRKAMNRRLPARFSIVASGRPIA
jgi:hypothetical protein